MITGGRHPFKGIFTDKESPNQLVEDYIGKFKETWIQTKKNLENAKETRPRPPPDIIDGDEEHEVEEVKQVRKRSGKKEFLIKWKGLPQEENTWEPEEHMTNARGVV